MRFAIPQGQPLKSRRQKSRHMAQSGPGYQADHTFALRAPLINSPIFAGSLIPGDVSTPLDTSTAQGCTTLIASETLAGESPPDSTIGRGKRLGIRFQSNVIPVPPTFPGT